MIDSSNSVSDEEIMNFMEELRAMLPSEETHPMSEPQIVFDQEVIIMNESLRELRYLIEFLEILGEEKTHPFRIEFHTIPYPDGTSFLSGYLSHVDEDGDGVIDGYFPDDNSSSEKSFREWLTTAIEEYKKRVASKSNKKSKSFMSPSNQLKPFLTPLQEVGINE